MYPVGMGETDIEKTRREVKAYLSRADHGSITRMLKLCKMSRQHFRRFRSGESISWKALGRIRTALDELTNTQLVAHEDSTPYSEVLDKDMWRLIEGSVKVGRTDLVTRMRELREKEEACEKELDAIEEERERVVQEMRQLTQKENHKCGQ